MSVIASTPKNPEIVDPQVVAGGTLTINDVTPLSGRSTGISNSAKAQQESIARQYGSSRTGFDAANN